MTHHKKSDMEKEADKKVALFIIILIAIPFAIVYYSVSGTYYGVKYISRSCCNGNDVAVNTSTNPDESIGIKPDDVIPVTILPPPAPKIGPSPSPPLPQMSALPPPFQMSAVQSPPPAEMHYVSDYHLGPGGLGFRVT